MGAKETEIEFVDNLDEIKYFERAARKNSLIDGVIKKSSYLATIKDDCKNFDELSKAINYIFISLKRYRALFLGRDPEL